MILHEAAFLVSHISSAQVPARDIQTTNLMLTSHRIHALIQNVSLGVINRSANRNFVIEDSLINILSASEALKSNIHHLS